MKKFCFLINLEKVDFSDNSEVCVKYFVILLKIDKFSIDFLIINLYDYLNSHK